MKPIVVVGSSNTDMVVRVPRIEGKTVLDAVRFANAAAALSVTRLGAQPSAPTRADIEKFIRRGM
jgi:sugar/nucleoside kinase (ribokinase family)